MDFAGGLVLVCCLCCLYSAASPTDTSQDPRSCSDPVNTEACFEPSVPYEVATQSGESALLRCVIRNRNNQVVTWMKNDGRDIPLTVGNTVFTPDTRVSLDNSVTDEWNLVIRLAEVNDTGAYLCQLNGRNGLMARAYKLVVEESVTKPAVSPVDRSDPKSDKRLLSDDQETRNRGKSPSVSISSEGTVFEGTRHFPMTCTARFSSRDAKSSPRVAIEWYHQGIRQYVNVSSIDISMSWADSDRAISVLTIDMVQMTHTGQWLCLKQPAEVGIMETAMHSLTVLSRDSSSAAVQAAAQSVDNSPAAAAPAASSVSLGIRSSVSNGCPIAIPRAQLHAAELLGVLTAAALSLSPMFSCI